MSGLVDFGAMDVDSVVGDLARLIGEWLDDDRPAYRLALQSYEQIRPLDPVETSFTDAFKPATGVADSVNVGFAGILLEDRSFDDPMAFGRGIARSIKQLERLAFSASGPRLLD